MKITLKDGSSKEYANAMSAYDIARDISEGLAIGPSIDTGFYYDFDCQSFDRETLDKIEAVQKELKANGVRTGLDDRSEKIGYKIREARLKRVPYILVVGQKEDLTDPPKMVYCSTKISESVSLLVEYVPCYLSSIIHEFARYDQLIFTATLTFFVTGLNESLPAAVTLIVTL